MVAKALANSDRMTALVRVLEAGEQGLVASDAWPSMKSSSQTRHLDQIRSFLQIDRPSKNQDAIYGIPELVRLPLEETIEALERLSFVAASKRRRHRVEVEIGADGVFLVGGTPVEDETVEEALRRALSSPPEDD